MSDFVDGAADLLHRSVGKDIALQFDVERLLPMAAVDANQFDLALLNLVVNARDAMPHGGVIAIALRSGSVAASDDLPAGRYLCLSVSDEGWGMDAETLKKAVEPFFSTKELGKGTGLGLSMIHGLAIQLNGALRLHSKPGEGTRAELWLPVTEEEVSGATEASDSQFDKTMRPLRVLFVDDDFLIAMGSVAMLEDLGHVVTEAHSGPTALDLLRTEQPFDLMITDFSMPKMNGAQLAAASRTLRPDLPILLATGYAELPSGVELDLPRLAKPYLLDDLEIEIANVMKAAPQG
ncbi:ATP-binding protein [Paracoccus sp. (in: a-proteobacteria)]|uniref:ATP-binding protein n=1 Tax=Paracoccus sp. TaxID=267 RepID=UPI00396C5AA4